MRMPAKHLNIHHVIGYYDHPLSGVCLIKDKWWWFDRVYGSRWVKVRRMSAWEVIKRRFGLFMFETCVGNHWRYKDGKRVSHFYWWKPEFLHRFLFKMYYLVKKLNK